MLVAAPLVNSDAVDAVVAVAYRASYLLQEEALLLEHVGALVQSVSVPMRRTRRDQVCHLLTCWAFGIVVRRLISPGPSGRQIVHFVAAQRCEEYKETGLHHPHRHPQMFFPKTNYCPTWKSIAHMMQLRFLVERRETRPRPFVPCTIFAMPRLNGTMLRPSDMTHQQIDPPQICRKRLLQQNGEILLQLVSLSPPRIDGMAASFHFPSVEMSKTLSIHLRARHHPLGASFFESPAQP
mmetsp:Transcript_18855/g.40586  ORF Transcript_18855/g.40586 Transcript_18855/m.40586 type:complete len:238 (-) Transcript_18855:434-1147(-)